MKSGRLVLGIVRVGIADLCRDLLLADGPFDQRAAGRSELRELLTLLLIIVLLVLSAYCEQISAVTVSGFDLLFTIRAHPLFSPLQQIPNMLDLLVFHNSLHKVLVEKMSRDHRQSIQESRCINIRKRQSQQPRCIGSEIRIVF